MQALAAYRKCAGELMASRLPQWPLACIAGLIGIFAAVPAWAISSCPVAPSPIKTCCIADQAGQSYQLGQDLRATGDCIEISAPRVVFSMGGSITGPGEAGIGLHVLSSAPNAVIYGQVIQGFAVGFKTDAANTFLYGIFAQFNKRGIIFNGVDDFAVQGLAFVNTRSGIALTANATGSSLYLMGSQENGANGIVLNGVTGASVLDASVLANANYGLWLKGASSNVIYGGTYQGNGTAGVYVGCHAAGPTPGACSIPSSNGNTLYNLDVGSYCGPPLYSQEYGVAIDQGSGGNHVYDTSTNKACSGAGDTTYDGYDANGGDRCHGNMWVLNFFALSNHNPPTGTFCIE